MRSPRSSSAGRDATGDRGALRRTGPRLTRPTSRVIERDLQSGVVATPRLDIAVLAATCAEKAIEIATTRRTRPRNDARREALASITNAEAAALALLLTRVHEGSLVAGSDFRLSFDRDLVGTV